MKHLLALVLLISTASFAQENLSSNKLKQHVGIQLNPYLFHLDPSKGMGVMGTLRYGINANSWLSGGAEVGFKSYQRYDEYTMFDVQAGLFVRFTYPGKKVSPFIEFNSFASYGKKNTYVENSYSSLNNEFRYLGIKYFVAPGLSMPIINERFSLDLMLKITSQDHLSENSPVMPAFKFKYRF